MAVCSKGDGERVRKSAGEMEDTGEENRDMLCYEGKYKEFLRE